jgi:hypothetical protein
MDWSEDDPKFFSGFSQTQAIDGISATLEMEVEAVRMLIRSISEDVTVGFLGTLWTEDTPVDDEEDEDEDEGHGLAEATLPT